MTRTNFSTLLIRWHRRHGRHDLPWQQTRDPYRVWLSEIMLQQTQVATVIPYYHRFLERFPSLAQLAVAPVGDVMALWSGLGYYARARNLHRCAQLVMSEHDGRFPEHPDVISRLPGIGRSTANAIAVFCFGVRAPILDGNVKRVLCRAYGIEEFPGLPAVEKRLWALAESLLPARRSDMPTYIQAQMDLGATVCTRHRPDCAQCPLAERCVAHASGRTATLPASRPRPPLPERAAVVLLLHDDGRILLERRPPSGIWGGLLSLPEPPAGADVRRFVRDRYGCTIGAPQSMTPLRHTFTHFRLTLHPWSADVRSRPRSPGDGDFCWLRPQELAEAGLPAPIRRIIAGFLDDRDDRDDCRAAASRRRV